MTSLAGYQSKQELEVIRGELVGGEIIKPYAALAYRELDITNGGDRAYLKQTAGAGRMQSQEGWQNYRRIGEVRYAITRSARIAGYAQLKAVKVDRAGRVTQEPVDGRVAEIVASIYSRFGGTRGLVERYYTLRKVPGEAYLVGLRDDGMNVQDGYWFLSPSEIVRDNVDPIRAARNNMPIRWVTSRYSTKDGAKSEFERFVQPQDFYGRIWNPDGEYTDDVQSPMQAINGMCEMLHTLTEGIMSRLLQRFTLAGILLIPNDISDAAISGYAPADNTYSNDKVMNYLIHVMSRNVEKHNTNLAAMPILLKGPPESLEKLRHLVADVQAASEQDLKLRNELIGRILDSLDQQKAASTGGQDTNHWCVDEETEILTQRGWLTHQEVRVGDVTLTLNHDTGLSEWQPIEHIYRAAAVDEPMVALSTGAHNSLTTLAHRWPVLQRTTEDMTDGSYRRWKTSAELNSGSQVIGGAPSGSQPSEAKWSDALVELIGWMWTEGSFEHRQGRDSARASIAQSHQANPHKVASIRRALTALYGPAHEGPMPSSRRGPANSTPRWRAVEQASGMTEFRLNTVITRHLAAICPGRVVDPQFIREMTVAQLGLFIDTSLAADGHVSAAGQRTITQKNPSMLDGIELAAILAGYRVRRWSRSTEGFTTHVQYGLSINRKTTFSFQKGGIEQSTYTGTVWCPTTTNSSWMARRGGVPFFTGNSMWAVGDEERRITVQPDLEDMCHALTRTVLWRELKALKWPDGKILPWRVWFDLSAASVKSNMGEDARQAYDRNGTVNAAFLRKVIGAGDSDVMSDEEYVRWVGVKLDNPVLATYKLPGLDGIMEKAQAWGAVTPGPNPASEGTPEKVGPGTGSPGSPDSRDSDTPKTQEPG